MAYIGMPPIHRIDESFILSREGQFSSHPQEEQAQYVAESLQVFLGLLNLAIRAKLMKS